MQQRHQSLAARGKAASLVGRVNLPPSSIERSIGAPKQLNAVDLRSKAVARPGTRPVKYPPPRALPVCCRSELASPPLFDWAAGQKTAANASARAQAKGTTEDSEDSGVGGLGAEGKTRADSVASRLGDRPDAEEVGDFGGAFRSRLGGRRGGCSHHPGSCSPGRVLMAGQLCKLDGC